MFLFEVVLLPSVHLSHFQIIYILFSLSNSMGYKDILMAWKKHSYRDYNTYMIHNLTIAKASNVNLSHHTKQTIFVVCEVLFVVFYCVQYFSNSYFPVAITNNIMYKFGSLD